MESRQSLPTLSLTLDFDRIVGINNKDKKQLEEISKYECSVCLQSLARDPHTCPNNGHSFCRNCFIELYK